MGAHAVMSNGGVMVPVGLHMVALAARRHAVPFVVLAGLHKVYYSTRISSLLAFEVYVLVLKMEIHI